jgi:hypothetical protein
MSSVETDINQRRIRMRKLYGIFAVAAVSLILVIAFSQSRPAVEAQGGNRQIEVKRVNLSNGQATTQTLGVVVGISCLELSTGVNCFVVSTR